MARLLSPEDFGIYTAGAVALMIASYINDLGIEPLLVRWPGRLEKVAPTATTLVALMSCALFLTLFVSAPWCAAALGSPDGAGIVRLMAVALLISGIFTVNSAQVNRAFLQRARTKSELKGLVANSGLGITLALVGFGPYSLALGQVFGNLVTSIGLFRASPEHFRPGFDRVVARQLLKLGIPLSASGLFAAAALNLDFIVVGNMLGAAALGLYVLAWNVASWPVNAFIAAVQHVSVAGFAKLQDDRERLQNALTKSIRAAVLATAPMCAILAAVATPLVHTLYGVKWEASAGPLALLAILGCLRVPTALTSDLFVAAGWIRATFILRSIWFLSLGVILPIGAFYWGIVGVAAGQVIVMISVVIPAYAIALRMKNIRLRPIIIAMALPIGASIVAYGVAGAASLVALPSFAQLLVGSSIGALAYAILTVALWLPACRKWWRRTGRVRVRKSPHRETTEEHDGYH